MKKMKKFSALLIAVLMLFSLAACQDGDDSGISGPDGKTSASGAGSGEIETVTDGVLTMATNAEFPPYEYHEGGQVVGIDATIAQAIAGKLGLSLQIDDMEFTSIIASVTGGKADMGMAGMTVTKERLTSVDFSSSYATGVQVVIVPEDSEITDVDDLLADGANYNIGVQESTTGDIYATDDIEDEGLGTIHRYNKGADAVQAMIAGKVDCVIIDNEPAKAYVAANAGIKILDTKYVEEDYAICFSKENPALSKAVDEALQELIDDGTVAVIISEYIKVD